MRSIKRFFVELLILLISVPALAKNIELILSDWGGDLEVEAIKQVCEKWNKMRPDIKVKQDSMQRQLL